MTTQPDHEGGPSTRLVRIETKLDSALSRGDDHEKRIRQLERIGALVIAAGGIIAYLQGVVL